MYKHFKNDLMLDLNKRFNYSAEDMQNFFTSLDLVLNNYTVSKNTPISTDDDLELPTLVQTYLTCKQLEGFAKGTIYNYTRALSLFFKTIKKLPEDVTTNDIRVYLYNYQQERKISNSSLEKIRCCLSSFYKWCVAEEYLEKNPVLPVKKIKFDKPQRKPCTQIDLEYLRLACNTPKQKAILETLYSTGCRVGELANLKKSDIDWQAKTVHLFGKGQKHRTSFLNAKAEVALKEYLKTRTDNNEFLFVSDRKPYNEMHVSGIQKIIREMAKRAGENLDKKVSPHILRHTTATRMLENNADITSIQAILGHENINTTMIYAHSTLGNVKMDHSKAVV